VIKCFTEVKNTGHTAAVHNVWPAGHIRPVTGPDVARNTQQEKRQLHKVAIDIKSTVDHKSSTLNQLTTIFNLTSLGLSWRCPLWSL